MFGVDAAISYDYQPNDYFVITPKLASSYDQVPLKGYDNGVIKVAKSKEQKLSIAPSISLASFIDSRAFTLIPELHAEYSHNVWRKGKAAKLSNQLNQLIIKQNSKDSNSFARAGAGLTIAGNNLELSGGYDRIWLKKILGHIGHIKLRVNF